MSTATKTRRPRLGQINIGDAIDTPKGLGIVKSIEQVHLFRTYGRPAPPTPRYQLTDGDYTWHTDRRDVRSVVLRGAAKVKENAIALEDVPEAIQLAMSQDD